jgi:hypothetical protein
MSARELPSHVSQLMLMGLGLRSLVLRHRRPVLMEASDRAFSFGVANAGRGCRRLAASYARDLSLSARTALVIDGDLDATVRLMFLVSDGTREPRIA